MAKTCLAINRRWLLATCHDQSCALYSRLWCGIGVSPLLLPPSTGRAASGGALAPQPPRATRKQPERKRTNALRQHGFPRFCGVGPAEPGLAHPDNLCKTTSFETVRIGSGCAAAPGLKPLHLPRALGKVSSFDSSCGLCASRFTWKKKRRKGAFVRVCSPC